ncbi:hypothetical protein ETB97_007187 [Aspergillus alliaceus]|uniref:Uncharacterized protein n=1 Tax=Petromyces alliaceus TaxID=209559 RepID=A0A8H6E9L7_PETAA|nr:hypothetical protein ETB97_007187 [Aspergillus burnettii]
MQALRELLQMPSTGSSTWAVLEKWGTARTLRPFTWQLCDIVIEGAREIPHDQPLQDRLVELRGFDPMPTSEEALEWTNLNTFAARLLNLHTISWAVIFTLGAPGSTRGMTN